jgi:6-phosphogluconolactonase (cycloisomerase 2 family)
MSILRAAFAALVGQSGVRRIFAAVSGAALMAFFLSCGGSGSSSANGPVAYVTLPADGSILLLRLDPASGTLTSGGTTPVVPNTSPTGIALLPSKKFLYAANSRDNSISTFSVALDGTLAFANTTPAQGSSPNGAAIDPSGQFLLVTNNLTDNISVFGISPSTGALSLIGSPVGANANPTEIRFTHSGKFVYVTNPGIGTVTGFSFDASGGLLTQITTVVSGAGADALAVDATNQYLYVANVSASNPPPYTNITGNISGFSIDAGGGLTPLIGSPYIPTSGSSSGPSAIAVDPSGRFVYAVTAGSSASIWCFSITPADGELVQVADSPFSLAGGGLFLLFEPTGSFFYSGSNSPVGINGYSYNTTSGQPTAISGSPFSTGAVPGEMVISD